MDVEAPPHNVLVTGLSVGYFRVEVDVGIDLEAFEGLAVVDCLIPQPMFFGLPFMEGLRRLREIDVGVIRTSANTRISRCRGVCVVHNRASNLLLV